MPAANDFSEISVLIPGYSIEDLPTDLPEDGASSLLNAVACAWHPRLIQRSTSIPLFRQAESLSGYPGRRIVLVPQPSESWMPHEWRSVLRDQGHIVIAGCVSREDWLAAIETSLNDDEAGTLDSTEASPSITSPILVNHFLSLGTVLLQTQLLSRRRHHFVDADNLLLGRQIRLAADASLIGDDAAARTHLARCFEHLRETRERFYPLNCYLIDICIPSDDEEAIAIRQLLNSSTKLNLFTSGNDLTRWLSNDATLAAIIKDAVNIGQLELLTGHDAETRTSLGSMANTINDLERCIATVKQITGNPPRHWARRRYGLTASMPALLNHMGFESALHVALDDGLYPDRERSQFDWQAPDGSIIAASSRIPLAVDSASGFLRFAERYNESMQDDTTAALFLARLPSLKSPWLHDLQIAAGYAPVLGEFATIGQLCHAASGSRLAERHEHSDYLSPFLIQSSVLKTESPVSGPASLRQLTQRLESLRTLLGMATLIRAGEAACKSLQTLTEIETEIAKLELDQVDVTNTTNDRLQQIQNSAKAISKRLDQTEISLAAALQSKVPSKAAGVRGLFIVNTIPFARFHGVAWPKDWAQPAASKVIELAERVGVTERLLVKLPPGGFAWLTEAEFGQATQPILEPIKSEPPLAESLTLRNRHFEVTLSDKTGGVSAVTYHQQRANRLSQQLCFRYERDQTLPDDGSGEIRKTAYAVARLIESKVVDTGTVFAAIETVVELVSPVDESVLAVVRQKTSVDRVQPRVKLNLRFESVANSIKGNPWLTYFGCRFAWDNESAAITRAVMGQAAGFRAERFESPDYVEISDTDHRVVIATHGRPYHRRSGPRMLDSLLIVEGESSREFNFTIDFDQPFPLRTSTEALNLPLIQPTTDLAPTSIPSGWIVGLSAKHVDLVQTFVRPATEETSEELTVLLAETEGISGSCLIRTARQPSAAFSVNAERTEKVSLEITSQGVVVPFNAFQIKCVMFIL